MKRKRTEKEKTRNPPNHLQVNPLHQEDIEKKKIQNPKKKKNHLLQRV